MLVRIGVTSVGVGMKWLLETGVEGLVSRLTPLSITSNGRLAADFHQASLYNLIDLLSYLLHLIFAVEISPDYFIGFNEAIKLSL